MGREHEKNSAEQYKVPSNDPDRVKAPSDLQDADDHKAAAYAAQCELDYYKSNDGNAGPRRNIKQVADGARS